MEGQVVAEYGQGVSMADFFQEKAVFQKRLGIALGFVISMIVAVVVISSVLSSPDILPGMPQSTWNGIIASGWMVIVLMVMAGLLMSPKGLGVFAPRLFCPHCHKHVQHDRYGWKCPFCDHLNGRGFVQSTILFRCGRCRRSPPAWKCEHCGGVTLLTKGGESTLCATKGTEEDRLNDLSPEESFIGGLAGLALVIKKLQDHDFDFSKAELSFTRDLVAIERERKELEKLQNRPKSEEERMKEDLEKRLGQIRAKIKAVRSSADIFMELGKYQNEINNIVDANQSLTSEQKARIKETIADQLKRVVVS
jgi:hypothetical protein